MDFKSTSQPSANLKVSIPKKGGGVSEHFYVLSAENTAFGTASIEGPSTTGVPPGHVRYDITVPKTVSGVEGTWTESLTLAGAASDYDTPTLDGPVLVVQDPPACKFRPRRNRRAA